jgi:DNA-binding transcriptional LysR family regulator
MTHPLDSELLRTFLAVADTGNLTRGAQLVHRTQSAVSMQIKRLEEEIGTPLFVRGPRGVALTAKGDQLLSNARRIVSLIDETTASMSAPPLTGPVRLGVPEEYGVTVLSHALEAFAKVHPEVEISLRYGRSGQNMQALAADELDLAVVFEWTEFTGCEVLTTDPTVWITSEMHGQHRQRPLPIAVSEDPHCWDLAVRLLEIRGLPYRVAARCNTIGSAGVAVLSGLAIAPFSRSNIPVGCRELTLADGFGDTDAARVVMHRSLRARGEVVDSMARAIRNAFQRSPLAPADRADNALSVTAAAG